MKSRFLYLYVQQNLSKEKVPHLSYTCWQCSVYWSYFTTNCLVLVV